VVRNLAAVNGCAALALVGYAYAIGMPLPSFFRWF
jgi:hypothetical protein